jgi:hypothetical protein
LESASLFFGAGVSTWENLIYHMDRPRPVAEKPRVEIKTIRLERDRKKLKLATAQCREYVLLLDDVRGKLEPAISQKTEVQGANKKLAIRCQTELETKSLEIRDALAEPQKLQVEILDISSGIAEHWLEDRGRMKTGSSF